MCPSTEGGKEYERRKEEVNPPKKRQKSVTPALQLYLYYAGEPNGDQETCVELYRSDGKWNDMFCSDLKAFTCKMPASNYPVGTVTTTTAVPDCKFSFYFIYSFIIFFINKGIRLRAK